MTSQLLSLLNTGRQERIHMKCNKTNPRAIGTDETWLTKRNQFCLCYTSSSSKTDNGYQGLWERKWKSTNNTFFPQCAKLWFRFYRGWKLKWQHPCQEGQLQEGYKLRTARVEDSDIKTKQGNQREEEERKPQVGSKSKPFGKHRRMCVFSIKFPSVKKGTKESLQFRERRESIHKIRWIL